MTSTLPSRLKSPMVVSSAIDFLTPEIGSRYGQILDRVRESFAPKRLISEGFVNTFYSEELDKKAWVEPTRLGMQSIGFDIWESKLKGCFQECVDFFVKLAGEGQVKRRGLKYSFLRPYRMERDELAKLFCGPILANKFPEEFGEPYDFQPNLFFRADGFAYLLSFSPMTLEENLQMLPGLLGRGYQKGFSSPAVASQLIPADPTKSVLSLDIDVFSPAGEELGVSPTAIDFDGLAHSLAIKVCEKVVDLVEGLEPCE